MMVVFYLLLFICGLSFGSFLNALEWRLHTRQKLTERSKCPHCGTKIPWYHNIPLVSFFLLRRTSSCCHKKISWQYPIIEFLIGVFFIFVAVYHHSYDSLFLDGEVFSSLIQIARDWIVVFALVFIFVYDFKYMEVVDSITLGAAAIILVLNGFVGIHTWAEMVIGMAAGGLFFFLQYVLSKGRWVGGGDARIGILMGAILGWKLLLLGLWIAYIVGAIVSVGLLLTKKKNMKSPVPFGVFLTVATFVVMLWGQGVLDWYMQFIF